MSIYRGATMVDDFNVSFDLHGVINHDIDYFIELSNDIRNIGGKVYVISGSSMEEMKEQLEELKFPCDGMFSATDFLIEEGFDWKLDKHGRPSFKTESWNAAKGMIIRKLNESKGIKIVKHYDDTFDYGKYMPSWTMFHWYVRGRVTVLTDNLEKVNG